MSISILAIAWRAWCFIEDGTPKLKRMSIPWATLTTEQEVSDQIWTALPKQDEYNLKDICDFIKREQLVPVMPRPELVYAYADRPKVPGSPVEAEWFMEFRFEANILVSLYVEEHLVGP